MKYEDIIRSNFRYPRPSFLRGFAGAINLFGRHDIGDVISKTPAEDDALAIEHDWKMVGRDLQQAFDNAGCK